MSMLGTLKKRVPSALRLSIAGSLSLKLASLGLGFLLSVVLAQTMSVSEFGKYSHIYSLLLVATAVVQLGFAQLIVRETASHHANDEFDYIKGIGSFSSSVVILASVLVSVGIYLLYDFDLLQAALKYEIALSSLLVLCALLLFTALGNLRGALLRGMGRVVLGQFPENIIRPSAFLLSIMLVLYFVEGENSNLTAEYALTLQLGSAFCAFLFGVIVLWRCVPREMKLARGAYLICDWSKAVIPLAGVAIIQMLNLNVGIVILGILSSTSEVAILKIATVCSSLTFFCSQAINMVIAPIFARVYRGSSEGEDLSSYFNSSLIIITLTLPVTVFFLLYGTQFLSFFFGSSYTLASPSLRILTSGIFISLCFGPITILLSMTRNVWFMLKVSTCFLIVNIIICVFLAGTYGAIGVSFSTSIVLVLQTGVLWVLASRKYKLTNIYSFTGCWLSKIYLKRQTRK